MLKIIEMLIKCHHNNMWITTLNYDISGRSYHNLTILSMIFIINSGISFPMILIIIKFLPQKFERCSNKINN